MFQVETPDERDWIFVFDGNEEFEIQRQIQCDLCDKKIPSFILCKDCKKRHRPLEKNKNSVQKEDESESTILFLEKKDRCDFCERDVQNVIYCKQCHWKLCENCKFGDDLIPEGVNCCEYKKLRESIQEEEIKEKDPPSIQSEPKPIVIPAEHRKLYKEFLELV